MLRLVPLVALLALALPATASAAPAEYVPGRVVVGFASDASAAERSAARADVDAGLVSTLGDARQQLLDVEGSTARAIAELRRDPAVAFAERDQVIRAAWAPDDTYAPAQWALTATGVLGAWDLSRGAGALVGIVDTGADFAHPDLGRFWVNPGEIAGNGVDDDGNGRIDDVHGYDFVSDDGDPSDDQGHGTSVTGVIAAQTNNGIGVAGVAPEASVIHAKALGADGTGTSSAVATSMRYLAQRGARVVNLSLGGPTRSVVITSAVAAYPETLFVVAAGNAAIDNDQVDGRNNVDGTWPCNEPAANVICVGASERVDPRAEERGEQRASFSNYGRTSVDLMAPGESLLSTGRGGGYVWASGTSFSAPMVTGAAALLLGRRPAATAGELRTALLSTVTPLPAYAAITATGGRLDVAAATQAIPPGAPAQVLAPSPPPPPAPAPAIEPVQVPGPAARPAPATRPAKPRSTPVKGPSLSRAIAKRCGTAMPRRASARNRRARCVSAVRRQVSAARARHVRQAREARARTRRAEGSLARP